MIRDWSEYENMYSDKNKNLPLAKTFLDNASGLNKPFDDEMLQAGNHPFGDLEATGNGIVFLPGELFSVEAMQMGKEKSVIADAVEVDDDNEIKQEDIVSKEPKITET